MPRLAIIVTGDRYWGNKPVETAEQDVKLLRATLDKLQPDILIQGGAPGADSLSGQWAEDNEYLLMPRDAALAIPPTPGRHKYHIEVPAQWNLYGRAAGPIRNEDMRKLLEEFALKGYTVEVHGFHHDLNKSRGTKHMLSNAEKHGIKTVLHS